MPLANKILFSKSHLCHPFEIKVAPHRKPVQLSAFQKVFSIGIATLVGACTFGIGGVAVFYTTTAAMKAMKVRHMSRFTPLTPVGIFNTAPRRRKMRRGAHRGITPVFVAAPKRHKTRRAAVKVRHLPPQVVAVPVRNTVHVAAPARKMPHPPTFTINTQVPARNTVKVAKPVHVAVPAKKTVKVAKSVHVAPSKRAVHQPTITVNTQVPARNTVKVTQTVQATKAAQPAGILKKPGHGPKVQKGVAFGVARGREFNKHQAPNMVGQVSSVEIKNLNNRPARQVGFRA